MVKSNCILVSSKTVNTIKIRLIKCSLDLFIGLYNKKSAKSKGDGAFLLLLFMINQVVNFPRSLHKSAPIYPSHPLLPFHQPDESLHYAHQAQRLALQLGQ